MIFESIYLRILNRISKRTAQIGSRVRTPVVFACLLIIAVVFSLDPQSIKDSRRMIFISVIVFTMTLALTEGELKPVRWNKLQMLAIELFALIMIIIRGIHPVGQGYMIFALDILILFPMLYTVLLNKKNQARYYDILSFAVITAGIACFVFSTFLALTGGDYVLSGRVFGITKNSNFYGMVGLALMMSGLYSISRERGSICWDVMMAVSAGIGISMILAAVSRTAMLSAACCGAVFIVFVIRTIRSGKGNRRSYASSNRKRLLGFIFLVILILLSAFASLKLQQLVFFSAQSDGGAPLTSIQTVYAEDGNEEITDESQSTIKDRLSSDNDINRFSSGRISLWKRYSLKMNLLGNDYDAEVQSGIFAGLKISKAHNNIVDYAFRFGIPAGAVYVLFFITIMIKVVAMAFWSRRFTAKDMWAGMTVASYMIYALVEVSTLPFTRYLPCLFFLSAAPIMGAPANKTKGDAYYDDK